VTQNTIAVGKISLNHNRNRAKLEFNFSNEVKQWSEVSRQLCVPAAVSSVKESSLSAEQNAEGAQYTLWTLLKSEEIFDIFGSRITYPQKTALSLFTTPGETL